MRAALCILLVGCATTAEPDDRFLPGKADGAYDLREHLHRLVDNHIALTYSEARDAMFGVTANFDVHDGYLECIYTGRLVAPDGTHTPGGFNTEHVWPQSQGAEVEPPRSDLHHLFPVDTAANSARANDRFGVAHCNPCAWQEGGSSLDASDPAAPLFEVRPDRSGDIARAKFYFAIRYELTIPTDEEAVLRAWHTADPPDERERARTEAIYELQHNRNPFVIWPELVERIEDF